MLAADMSEIVNKYLEENIIMRRNNKVIVM